MRERWKQAVEGNRCPIVAGAAALILEWALPEAIRSLVRIEDVGLLLRTVTMLVEGRDQVSAQQPARSSEYPQIGVTIHDVVHPLPTDTGILCPPKDARAWPTLCYAY